MVEAQAQQNAAAQQSDQQAIDMTTHEFHAPDKTIITPEHVE